MIISYYYFYYYSVCFPFPLLVFMLQCLFWLANNHANGQIIDFNKFSFKLTIAVLVNSTFTVHSTNSIHETVN